MRKGDIVEFNSMAMFNTLPTAAYNVLEKQVQRVFNSKCFKKLDIWGREGLNCPCRPNSLDNIGLPILQYFFTMDDGSEAKFSFNPKYYFMFDVKSLSRMETERDCLLLYKPESMGGNSG